MIGLPVFEPRTGRPGSGAARLGIATNRVAPVLTGVDDRYIISSMTTLPRISPLAPPYTLEVEQMLAKWMPPNSEQEPLKLFRTIVRHETLSQRMRPLGSALLGHGTLPARTRELLVLRTCARCRAEYEWGVHVTAFAAAVGLDERTIVATVQRSAAEVAAGDSADDSVMRLADELHDFGTATDVTWAELARHYDEPALLEMLAVVGFYHLISFVANGARVEREPWAARFPR